MGWVPTPSAGSTATAKASRSSTDQVIGDASLTAIAFDTEDWDDDGIVDVGGANPSRLTIQTAGKYIITAGLWFDANATGVRAIYIRKGGSTYLISSLQTTVGGGNVYLAAVSIIDDASADDYYETIVFQDSGGDLNLNADARNHLAVGLL